MIDQPVLAPFVLDEGDPAHSAPCLMLFDADLEEVEDVFDELNAEGNGHGWEGLAQSLVHSAMPEIADRLEFGSESGTFVVTSSDIHALRQLGTALHTLFHDRGLLAQQILAADPTYLPR
ncbi:hypothetical protein CLM62_09655 [Streptomyces sp. SA15]|uniref:Imm51 family immunity protein n=1 Tax=Streptomyces sp. SA15 TaxID=934019 RepID=UPI000BAF389B|nr:Imm51 family immunity protein [Streptomyces sp. SA15]PAZ16159.1 hypothetical protein CLM62_09655 [Streptomyces sp. SA15]